MIPERGRLNRKRKRTRKNIAINPLSDDYALIVGGRTVLGHVMRRRWTTLPCFAALSIGNGPVCCERILMFRSYRMRS